MGKDVYPFVAAEGHNGPKSKDIVKHYAENLGLRYFVASSKEEFDSVLPKFLEKGTSVILEAFTNDADENEAFLLLRNLIPEKRNYQTRLKKIILKHLKPEQIQKIKGFLGK